MERLLLKAASTAATDEGVFTAVISAASVDREKDIVDPAGMVRALHKWVPTGKNIPLAWNHSTAPEHQIGYVDPKSARVQSGEVVVDGYIDQSTDSGAHAWRQVKMGTLGFSFGYLTLDSAKRQGGGRHIKDLDVYEITASPMPMNNDTRVLAYKASTAAVEAHEADTLQGAIELMRNFLQTEDDQQDIESARDIIQRVQALLTSENDENDNEDEENTVDEQNGKSLRERAALLALEIASGGLNPEAKSTGVPEPEEDDENDDDDEAKALIIPRREFAGAQEGHLKAVWTTAYVNTLPDSAFLYVKDGGTKDSDGKTVPRSNRMFPYKDANGAVDLPHLRNALARIPQSNLPQDVKDKLTAKAQRVLDEQKSVVGSANACGRAEDPLRQKAQALALEIASGGMSLQQSPPQIKVAKPEPEMSLADLRERTRLEMLTVLSGLEIEP